MFLTAANAAVFVLKGLPVSPLPIIAEYTNLSDPSLRKRVSLTTILEPVAASLAVNFSASLTTASLVTRTPRPPASLIDFSSVSNTIERLVSSTTPAELGRTGEEELASIVSGITLLGVIVLTVPLSIASTATLAAASSPFVTATTSVPSMLGNIFIAWLFAKAVVPLAVALAPVVINLAPPNVSISNTAIALQNIAASSCPCVCRSCIILCRLAALDPSVGKKESVNPSLVAKAPSLFLSSNS